MIGVFKGRQIAYQKEESLKKEVSDLKKDGVTPKLTSILLNGNAASRQYLKLKATAAKNIGAKLEIKELKGKSTDEVLEVIKKLNKDESVHGVMIQLPFPERYKKKEREKILAAISDKKDVDGMKEDSSYITPVVKAILTALKEAGEAMPEDKEPEVVVVGAKGFVGKRTVMALEEMDYEVVEVDIGTKNLKKKVKKADVVISVAGAPGFIKKDMVKKGVVLIDVGAPIGDIEKETYEKASFVTPVPGGIGPVTISSLLENLVLSAQEA